MIADRKGLLLVSGPYLVHAHQRGRTYPHSYRIPPKQIGAARAAVLSPGRYDAVRGTSRRGFGETIQITVWTVDCMLTLTSPPLVKTHTSSNGRTPRFPTGGGNIRRPKAVPMTPRPAAVRPA